ASLSAFKSALEKLTATDELPEYLRAKTQKNKKKGPVGRWLAKTFSTHPDISARFSFLQYKIDRGLPFNYYVTAPQRMRRWLSFMLQWRISLPLTATFFFALTW